MNEMNGLFDQGFVAAFKWKNAENWPLDTVTDNVLELTGYSKQEMLADGFTYFNLIHPEDRQWVQKKTVKYSQSDRQYFEQQYRITTKNGKTRWVRDHTRIHRNKKGAITHYVGYVIDITQQKEQEETLINKDEYSRAILNSIGDGVITTDLDANIIGMNPVAEQLTGWTEQQAKGRPLSEIFCMVDAQTYQKVENTAYLVLKTGKKVGLAYPTLLLSLDGAQYLIADSASPIFDNQCRFTGVVLVFRDVSQEYQLKSSIAENEEKYHMLFQAANDGIIIMDDQQFLDCNSKALTIFGCTYEEFVGKKPHELSPETQPDGQSSREKATEKIHAALMGQPQLFEWRHIRPNGISFDAEVSLSRLTYGGKDRLLTIIRDVTERKQDQERQAKMGEQLKNLLENLPDLLIIHQQGIIVYGNRAAVTSVGCTYDELVGSHVLERIWEGDREKAAAIMKKYTEETLREDYEIRVIRKNGEVRDAIVRSVNIDFLGVPSAMVILVDITERKQSEARVRESEENFRTFFDSTADLLFILDETGLIVEVNNTVVTRLEYTKEELVGQSALMIRPKNRWVEAGMILEKILAGKLDFCSIPVFTKSGTEILVETRITQGLWNGKPALFSVVKDVTQIKQSEEKFSHAFQSGSNLMSISNAQTGRFIDVNDHFLQTLEYSRNEVVGKTSKELNLFEDFTERETIRSQAVESGIIRDFELKMRTRTGKRIIVLLSSSILHVGEEACLLTTMMDITERKRSEEALVQQTKLQKMLMNIASSYINIPINEVSETIQGSLQELGEFISADQNYIFDYNSNWESASMKFEWCGAGITPHINEMQNMPVEDFREWANEHRKGNIVYVEDVQVLPDSPPKAAFEQQGVKSLLSIPMMSDNVCIGFVGFHSIKKAHRYSDEEIALLRLFSNMLVNVKNREQTEVKLLETNHYLKTATEKAKEMAAHAEQANRSKSVFLANMSHEIRTPLNAIIGFSQLLNRDRQLSESQKEYLTSIIRAGEHLLALINDILELSKVEAGRIELNPTNVDLHSLFEDIRMIFKERSESKHLQLICETSDDLPHYVMVDEGKLRQILVNLIGNAIKFTDVGGVAVRVRTDSSNCSGTRLYVEVQDSGSGIPENEFDKLFKHFEQTSSGIKKGSGTGLGLALSRELARLMGGDISVSSEVGKGSVFAFSVKLEEGKEEAVETTSYNRVQCIANGDKEYRILVVDDKAENLHVAVNLLKMVGFKTNEAVNGMDAIEKFEAWHPHIILMDMRMPVMDGYEAILRIKSTEMGKQIPIIALTASAFGEEQKKIEQLNVQGYIRKPFRESELFGTIGKLLGVTYLYENDKVAVSSLKYSTDDSAIFKDVAKLPESLVLQMKHAVSVADLNQLITLINSIDAENSELSNQLKTLANNYDYDFIQQLLNKEEVR